MHLLLLVARLLSLAVHLRVSSSGSCIVVTALGVLFDIAATVGISWLIISHFFKIKEYKWYI